ncbi:sulfatase-like hydrolase/transferase [Fodinibius salsisoli]|uniref:Sulfatase-like hydrolase/transferase n=1 Tax=Fodinibius salsisoli TaxID=2820877 RepID=A0ABT3PLJ6_9BACT|nr:sulfatase-like hydrolase/transferase [Fodinibius salsisoli]MCW9706598.1 sulfatase-like hydrolase/transferase [Fodinibius salsisoli]
MWITSEDNSPFLGAYGDSLANTPNLDRLAERGVVYENAFATTPVCAPSRFTLITGLYANVMGTENMRSSFPTPDEIQFFPKYLQEAGYYTTNNVKKDYNTVDQPETWDESSDSAHYESREEGQPFFHVRNFTVTHESRLHDPVDTLIHDPDEMNIPPYHPETSEIKTDWAHYYDQVTKLDTKVGQVLEELKESGEAENTIIFYYSDHGGVLPRSKRFMFESGLHVPLIVYFPPKYEHMAPDTNRTDRLVSFVDFPATVLSLAGIEPPGYMHGKPFLGEYAERPREYLHAYRGRMDERIDLIRAVRDKEYLYVRNFMPHRIYGQHLAYLWRAPSMQSWYEEYENNNLNEVQQRFFEEKPAEELYKISSDPHNINNLAGDPQYRGVLKRMRQENISWMKKMNDLGVIPEETIDSIRQGRSLYDAVRTNDVPIGEIVDVANQATRANAIGLDSLSQKLNHPDETIRFWSATAFSVANPEPKPYREILLKHAEDSSVTVRIAIAEALYNYGEKRKALSMLTEALNHEHTFVKLRALNTIQALNTEILPNFLIVKIKELEQAHDEQWGTDYYIRRASKSILGENK